MNGFRFPGGDARTVVIGATGTGKTTCGAWLLSYQRFDKRPWLIFDFKREEIFDRVGFPPIQQLDRWRVPKEPGLYLISPHPGQTDDVERFLWQIWERENIGLFIDEAFLMPNIGAFPAILQQGRSKRIPVIACTQRPVEVPRAVFSESGFFCVFRVADRRDYRVIEGFAPLDFSRPLPPRYWQWYDVAENVALTMSQVPDPDTIVERLKQRVPYKLAWHPFGWTAQPTAREPLQQQRRA